MKRHWCLLNSIVSGLAGYFNAHIRVTWQDFGRRVGAGIAFGRRHLELSPCWTETDPGGSESDLPLSKAKPISDSGGVPVIFKKG